MTPMCCGGDATATIPHYRRRPKERRQAIQSVSHVVGSRSTAYCCLFRYDVLRLASGGCGHEGARLLGRYDYLLRRAHDVASTDPQNEAFGTPFKPRARSSIRDLELMSYQVQAKVGRKEPWDNLFMSWR